MMKIDDDMKLYDKFIDFINKNEDFIKDLFEKEEVAKTLEHILIKTLRSLGQIDPRFVAAFGIFIASNYDEITGNEMPDVFKNFIETLKIKEI